MRFPDRRAEKGYIFGYPTTNIISRKDIANADIQTCDYYWLTKDWKLTE